MLSKYVEVTKTPVYWVPRVVLVLLCIVHHYTEYHVARTIPDLFYWPEGFCADMIVVGLFFVVAAWCIAYDVHVARKISEFSL